MSHIEYNENAAGLWWVSVVAALLLGAAMHGCTSAETSKIEWVEHYHKWHACEAQPEEK